MTSEKRIKQTLRHIEPDRIPLDLGASVVTGIHIVAYKNLLSYLGIKKPDFQILLERPQIAKIHKDVLDMLKVDAQGLFPNPSSNWRFDVTEDHKYQYFVDEWGVKWRRPKKNGYYFDVVENPLRDEVQEKDIDNYPWPDFADRRRIEGLVKRAQNLEQEKGRALVLEGPGGEIFDTAFLLRGYENFYVDLASRPSLACYVMDKMLELQLQFWEMALRELKEYVLVVRMGDDLGMQLAPRISPRMYRKYVKPRHRKLFSSVKKMAEGRIYIFFHTCGSVYDIIPDLIEVGIDILNPVQVSAAKMDTKRLKKEFGKELTFWGGTVDTQDVLPHGTPEEVKEEVKRRISDLAPGGGFVFSPVHNIQYDVPPQNIMAMWEALQEYGVY